MKVVKSYPKRTKIYNLSEEKYNQNTNQIITQRNIFEGGKRGMSFYRKKIV